MISEEEEEAQPTCRILWILILTIHRTASEEEEGEEEEEEQQQQQPHIDDTPRKNPRRLTLKCKLNAV